MRTDPFRTAAREPSTVLLVDDEPEILVALEDLLEDQYRVLSAASPEQGLAILAAEPEIAVIVSDQRMPGMTGDVFLARARAFSEAEALLLTGYADLSAVVSALNDGRISGYSHKPWDPALLLAMIRQAAERARLSAALRNERMLLHGMMESADDGLSFKDPEGRFIRLNRIAAQRLGHEVDDCIGRTERELAGRRDVPAPPGVAAELDALDRTAELDALEADDRQVLETGRGGSIIRSFERDGRMVWMERLRGVVRDEHDQVRVIASLERDVTQQKAMEERLRQADRMQALGTMAGGVAHDFNNLLTAILGSLELAQRIVGDPTRDPARLRRLIDTATAAAERGAALTQRLLSFSRQRSTALLPVDVNVLVQAMDDLLARSIDRPGIRIVQQLEQGLPPAQVDPAQLELALLNLCINARDAMQDTGRITLSTRLLAAGIVLEDGHELMAGSMPSGDSVAVSVQDTGTGIPPEVVTRIFEPFFTTKDVGRGTGLGLSMVYGFVQQVGGAVRIRTVRGVGTSFELCLPCAPAEPDP